MKKNYSITALLILIAIHAQTQGLLINAGTRLKAISNVSIVVAAGGITNNGTVDFNTADVIFSGNKNVFISGNKAISFRNLIINKSAGNLLLNKDVTITNHVSFSKGKLDLNGNNLLLTSSALLINETNNNRIIAPQGGEIKITLNLNEPVSANPGNLGAILTSNANMGKVTIARGHTEQSLGAGNKSIKRYFHIMPANNANLSATLRLTYFNAELNGLQESLLTLYAYKNNNWINQGFTSKSASLNYVELSNIQSFTKHTPGILNNNRNAANEQSVDIALTKELYNIILVPNPVISTTRLSITSPVQQRANISIYNSSGLKLFQQEKCLNKGSNTISLTLNNLQTGVYYLHVMMADGRHEKISFQKL